MLTGDSQIVMYCSNYKAIINSSDDSQQNALLVYLHANCTDVLPLEPSDEWLADVGVTSLEYDNAVTLLQNLGVVVDKGDDSFIVRTAT